MTNKMDSCFQITVNGFTAVFHDDDSNAFNRELVGQRSIVDEALESKWSYNPTEETHKALPYPYCD